MNTTAIRAATLMLTLTAAIFPAGCEKVPKPFVPGGGDTLTVTTALYSTAEPATEIPTTPPYEYVGVDNRVFDVRTASAYVDGGSDDPVTLEQAIAAKTGYYAYFDYAVAAEQFGAVSDGKADEPYPAYNFRHVRAGEQFGGFTVTEAETEYYIRDGKAELNDARLYLENKNGVRMEGFAKKLSADSVDGLNGDVIFVADSVKGLPILSLDGKTAFSSVTDSGTETSGRTRPEDGWRLNLDRIDTPQLPDNGTYARYSANIVSVELYVTERGYRVNRGVTDAAPAADMTAEVTESSLTTETAAETAVY